MTQQEYYPKVWTRQQVAALDAKQKGVVWRRTRKILRYAFGMTTLAEWLGVNPIDVHVNDADDRMITASIRIMGYLGWVIYRRATDEFTEYPIDLDRIARLVAQASSTE